MRSAAGREQSEYEDAVAHALAYAKRYGSESEVLALELTLQLLLERLDREAAAMPVMRPAPSLPRLHPDPPSEPPPQIWAPPAQAEVIELDQYPALPDAPASSDGEWVYDPPAWVDPDRVQPLSVKSHASGGINWKGTDDPARFGRGKVRLPFGAHHLDDFQKLDDLRENPDEH